MYIPQLLFSKFIMSLKQGCRSRRGGGGVGPGMCCPAFSALVTLKSTQLFYFKLRALSLAILPPSKTGLGP